MRFATILTRETSKMWKHVLVASFAFGTLAQTASAAVVYLRETAGTFAGNAVTQTPFDDAGVAVTSGLGGTTNTGAGGSNLSIRTTTTGITDRALFATKNLFTLIPKTSGSDTISVSSAKLHLFNNAPFVPDAGATVTVSRVTSNWLLSAAGSSEADVTGRRRQVSTSTDWASGTGFGASDFDTVGASTITWNTGTNAQNTIDITTIVQMMYSTETNYGVVVSTNSVNTLSIRASEQNSTTINPVFEITYTYVPVPEPVAASLLGLAGLFLGRRRVR
jgi:hypothetical protein